MDTSDWQPWVYLSDWLRYQPSDNGRYRLYRVNPPSRSVRRGAHGEVKPCLYFAAVKRVCGFELLAYYLSERVARRACRQHHDKSRAFRSQSNVNRMWLDAIAGRAIPRDQLLIAGK